MKLIVTSIVLFAGIIPTTMLSFRNATIVLYMVFKQFMTANYNKFILINGEHKPILKDAIVWTIVGMVVESLLYIVTVGGIMNVSVKIQNFQRSIGIMVTA